MSKPTYEELVDALEGMALQYLEHNNRLDHNFMSAGENALDCLERLGKVSGSGREYYFTPNSEYYDSTGV